MTIAPNRNPADPAGGPAWPRPWTLVWALAAAQLVSWGALYYSFSLFVVPMESELGWSRTAQNGALSLGLLVAGIVAYPVGAWIDRHGGRLLMSAGSLLGAVLLAAWSQVENIASLYVIMIGIGIATAANLYEPAFVVVTRLYPDSFRTKITAMTLVGGFASTVFIPLIQFLISHLGWRDALLVLAAIFAAVCLPIHALVLRDGPAPVPEPTPDSAQPLLGSAAVRRAAKTPVFWGLAVCFTFYYATFSALTFHLVPLLTDRRFSPEIVVSALAVIGPAQVTGRVVLLALGRRLKTATVGRIVVLMFPVSVLLLTLFPASLTALFAFTVLYGGANGIMTIIRGTAVPDLMWREGYGAINGALAVPSTAAKAAAPFAAALIWSASGGYPAVLWTIFCGSLVAALGFWFATRQRGPLLEKTP